MARILLIEDEPGMQRGLRTTWNSKGTKLQLREDAAADVKIAA